jgi:hypothetical protein
MIMGTSGCYMLNAEGEGDGEDINGIAGRVKDGIVPGLVSTAKGVLKVLTMHHYTLLTPVACTTPYSRSATRWASHRWAMLLGG